MRKLFVLCVLAPLCIAPAKAGTCGGVLNPVLIVASGVGFGLYAPSGTDAPSNGTITVACTVALNSTLPSFTIALLASATGKMLPREMTFLGNTLTYNLYTDGSYTTVWGDGTAPTETQSYGGGTASKDFTVYGSIPKRQFVPLGLYGDTITIKVTY